MFPTNLNSPLEKQQWFKNKVLRPTYQNQDKNGHRESFDHGKHKCPYPVFMYNDTLGTIIKEDRQLCTMGKGDWCANCWRWNRHRSQLGMSKRSYLTNKKNSLRSYLTTGQAYSVRRKPNPIAITNPYMR